MAGLHLLVLHIGEPAGRESVVQTTANLRDTLAADGVIDTGELLSRIEAPRSNQPDHGRAGAIASSAENETPQPLRERPGVFVLRQGSVAVHCVDEVWREVRGPDR